MKTSGSLLSSLDRRFSCAARQVLPDRYRSLLALPPDGKCIARGAGVSYVAASFGPNSLSVGMKSFDRILAFDEGARTIVVEAGVSLGKLHDFLSPKGLYLPVQPGHPQITIGGCIAFNIHGKNQFTEGLFDSCVDELELFHPAKGLLRVSTVRDPELFALTCGGFGLTGIIVSARLKLRPIPALTVVTRNEPVRSLRETFERIDELKARYDMLYSWNDFSRPGSGAGAGFITCGKFDSASTAERRRPVRTDLRARPGGSPFSLYNKLSLPLMNAAYRFAQLSLRREDAVSFYAFTYPVVDKTFYFDLFGSQGFIERQMLIPTERRWEYLERVERLVAAHKPLIALATVKAFKGPARLLNYGGDGLSLSFDVVGGGDRPFHDELDRLNVELGVLDNPAKDSRLSAEVMAGEYPDYALFQRRLRAHDPGRVFQSAMSERLGL